MRDLAKDRLTRMPMSALLHLVFEMLAFITGYRVYVYLRGAQGDAIGDDNRMWIIIGAAAGAFAGSRLLGAMEDPGRWAWNARAMFVALNNRTIVGGLLGGLVGVEFTKKLIGVRQSSGDLFVFPLIIGMIIGRIGCLFAGLEDNTYGIATTLPWGMDLGDGIRRHPTNLYEIGWLLTLGLILVLVDRKWKPRPGMRFALFMAGYLLFRLFVESIKPDPVVLWGLSAIQWAALIGLCYYYGMWRTSVKPLERP